MKRIISILSLLIIIMPGIAARGGCADPEVIQRLQELQRCIDTIKSKVTMIQIDIDDIDVNVTGIDDIIADISILQEVLCSKIENISITVQISSIDVQVSGIEDLEILISTNDALILSSIDVHASDTDALICSKVGDLDDAGSCLETLIDVPDAINNLNLNVIELLKTILLELRGCNQC